MKKGWKYRLMCGCVAMVMAGAGPAAVYADEVSQAAVQDALADGTLTEAEINAYFDGSVFVGDSVMMGFRNYAMNRGGDLLGRMQFLTAVSFSVYNSLQPVSAKSVHPIFMGQQRPVWESLALMQAKKVFLFFGLNDMNMGSLESTCARYNQLIANIKLTCPDAEIHLMSMTYVKQGSGKGNLTNPNIRVFNELLKQMALQNGWGFVDIATPLADANGDLAAGYCSDNYVHQTIAAYDVWSVVLQEYARAQLTGTSAFPIGGQKAPEEAAAAEETNTLDGQAEETQAEGTAEAPRVIRLEDRDGQNGPGGSEGN